ncbi:MAG: MarR family transcriptional regulator [Bacteroidota bacterium]|nr:MarR family transcriptional regulator [Bacteroidota bacterium]MDP4233817.1 MarR family transcriptional regulator [Bacteroidota bacterium]MDP4242484.1 MarR family transcriptional regulator [Bacteroidota bacterium]MDP4289038.1 MarR family transcriptional regulator [Bacteroidota bacterium]
MGDVLKIRLKMTKFESPVQEAVLALMVTASQLRSNMDRVLAEVGLTGEQFNILRILRGAGADGHPSGEISCRMIDRSPDVTRRIDALEAEGLVERERSKQDRRVVRVRITFKGEEVLDTIMPRLHEFEASISSQLNTNELSILAGLCEKIISVELDSANES